MSSRLATTLKPQALSASSLAGVMADVVASWSQRRVAGWVWQTTSEGPLTDEVCTALARHLVSTATTSSTHPTSVRGLTLVKRGSHRTVWRWDYDQESAYIKAFVRTGWSVALRSLLRGGLARREAQQLAAVRQSGLPVPTVWGWATCTQGRFSSLLVTAGVSGARPVSHCLADPELAPQQRYSLLTALGELIGRCASVGWTHHDFHGENILARWDNPAWKLTLVDTAAMRRAWGTVSRTRLFVQLRHSLHLSLSRTETLRLAQGAGLLSVRSPRNAIPPVTRQPAEKMHTGLLQEAATRFSLTQWLQQDRKWARGNSKQQLWHSPNGSGRALASIDPQSAADVLSCREVPSGLISLQNTSQQSPHNRGRCVVRAVPQPSPSAALADWLGGLALWRRGLPVLQPRLVSWTNPQAAWIGVEQLSNALRMSEWLELHPYEDVARRQILNSLTRWYRQAGETGCRVAPHDEKTADPAAWFVFEEAGHWQVLAGAELFNRVTFHGQRVVQTVPPSLVSLLSTPTGLRTTTDQAEAA